MKKNWKRIWNHISNFCTGIRNDHITAFSSEATLFTIISIVPFIMLFLTMLQYTPLTPDFFIRLLGESLPNEVTNSIEKITLEIFNPSRTVMSISAVTALWTASRSFMALFRGFNLIYKTGETRNSIILRFISILYTLGFVVLLILTFVLLVFGNRIYIWLISIFPWIKDIALLIISTRATVLLFLLFVFFLIMYIVIPNRKTTLLNELPGAVLSSCGWIIFSYAFSYYIDHYSNFSLMYGSLTSIVILMIWLYSCMYILLIGAEVNVHFALYMAKHKHNHSLKHKKSNAIKVMD